MNRKLVTIYFILLLSLFLLLPCLILAQSKDIILSQEGGKEEYRTERLALVIGVDEYINAGVPSLNYAVSDADAFADVLSKQGLFRVIEIGSDKSIKPTKTNILAKLRTIANDDNLRTIKTFVLFFSGHGFNVRGSNYLAPMEINILSLLNNFEIHCNKSF